MTIMGIATTTTTTTCCLKLPSPSSTSLSPPTSKSKLNQVSSWNGGGSWRKNCVVGMTCVIIGSEMMMMPVVLGQSEICASAAVVEQNNNMQIQVEGGGGVVRWSDKRTCPPWQTNSLEIVVPENLPRPSSHRRSDSIALSKIPTTSSSTVIRLAIRGQGSCFSM